MLVDTHVALWLAIEPAKLTPRTAELLADEDTTVLLSVASSWEFTIKWSVGKLPLPSPPTEFVPALMATFDLTPLPVTHRHAVAVADLPDHHRDPFDRLLVAQAAVEGVALVTGDDKLAKYDVEILIA
ncbi:MAG TPA: type II toxin-antitoxin system VapC family toxin [Cryptosporangiaceae bacterium]|nr:type II toxin-antitoxin system VapC family toxin [Cryptosporangiaceae bacterium]